LIRNSEPFGKNVRKPQGDFLTHTVHMQLCITY